MDSWELMVRLNNEGQSGSDLCMLKFEVEDAMGAEEEFYIGAPFFRNLHFNQLNCVLHMYYVHSRN